MKKDIEIPEVKNVRLAVVRKKNVGEKDEWQVHIINNNDHPIENTLVASKGYGEKDGEQQKTSTLRHFLETVEANSTMLIEPIDPTISALPSVARPPLALMLTDDLAVVPERWTERIPPESTRISVRA